MSIAKDTAKEEKPNWWKEEVVYQIYPKSFNDSNKDGIGDIPGIIKKLPYLKSLGITMLWICPIFPSPMVDNGYDISDYKGIAAEFGTMEDLDNLVHQAKDINIKIILDLVVNHSSDEHTWFQQALKNPNSKYRDYYIFKEGKNGLAPNNWRSIFGGSVWEPVVDEKNVFYFHTFDKRQPDLNWENPNLRREIYDMINWWLKRGIAGFRIDSITFIKKDQDYSSLPSDGTDGLVSVKNKGRNRPGISNFLTELNKETFRKYDCVSIGEAPGVQYDEYDQYIGENGYFDMIFDFHYADIDVENGSEWFRQHQWETAELNNAIIKSQLALQNNGWGANFLENHDQPRSISKYVRHEAYQNKIGATALATLFFLLRGTPFIYQGQELGMMNFKRESISSFNDVSSVDNYHRAIAEGFTKEESMSFVNKRSRDNGRTPFPWNGEVYGGFSEVTPWLQTVGNEKEINVVAQEHGDSVLNYYRKLIALRNNSIYRDTLIYGRFIPQEVNSETISYSRKTEKEEIQILVNLSPFKEKINLRGEILLSNYSLKIDQIIGDFILEPYQALVIRKDVLL